MRAKGYIDSASLHMVILALRHGKPSEWNDWTWETVQYVTCALWSLPDFGLPPDPSGEPTAHGPYSRLLKELRPVFVGVDPRDTGALAKTRRWVGRDPRARLAVCRRIQSDPRFVQWLDWYIAYFWERHCAMHGALFTREFIPEVARMVGCSDNDLTRLHALSGDASVVKHWVRKRPDSDEFRLALDSFCITTLLRGRYHDYAAQNAGVSIMHHPMRAALLPRRVGGVRFDISNTEQYLTNILIGSALKQTGITARLESWADNLLRVRAAFSDQRLDLAPKDRTEVAVECAVDAAKRSGIEANPHMLEKFVSILTGLAVSTLSGFFLDPWLAGQVGAGSTILADLSKAPERGVKAAYRTAPHLKALARAPAGRITRVLAPSVDAGKSTQ